jgi:hypothetical protein
VSERKKAKEDRRGRKSRPTALGSFPALGSEFESFARAIVCVIMKTSMHVRPDRGKAEQIPTSFPARHKVAPLISYQ